MLDNLADQLAIADKTADLLGDGHLGIIAVLVSLPRRQVDIDTGALARKNLGVEALAAQVDGGAVDLVEHDGGQRAQHLQRKVGALDDVDGRHERVKDDAGPHAVVDADGVGLADDADRRVFAARDEYRLHDCGFDFYRRGWVLVVFLRLFVSDL